MVLAVEVHLGYWIFSAAATPTETIGVNVHARSMVLRFPYSEGKTNAREWLKVSLAVKEKFSVIFPFKLTYSFFNFITYKSKLAADAELAKSSTTYLSR